MNADITLRQLEVLAAIGQEGTVTAAARSLGMTQSAASTSLSELERQLGVALFDRVGRRLVLNAAGEAVMGHAERAVSQAEEAVAAAHGVSVEARGRVTIAASTTIGNYLLPGVLTPLLLRHPELDTDLRLGATDAVVAWVESRVADFGLVEGPFSGHRVERTPWLADEIIIVCAPSHPLRESSAVTPEELSAARWIIREPGSGTRAVVEDALAQAGVRLDNPLEIGGTEAIKGLVSAGAGVAAISRRAIARELAAGALVELQAGIDMPRMFTMITARNAYLGGAARTVLDAISAWDDRA